MNTEDVFGLVRSGNLFAAVSPNSMRQLHNLRRFLGVDCPNTYQEVVATDAGISRGQQLDTMIATILDNIMFPRVQHTLWSKSSVKAVSFNVIDDPFYYRGCLLHTAPRRCEHRRSVDVMIPSEEPVVPDTLARLPAPTLACVVGSQLQSIAVLEYPLTKVSRHRCTVQVIALPHVESALSLVQATPQKGSQSALALPEHATSPAVVEGDGSTPSAIAAASGAIFTSPLRKPPLTATSIDLAAMPSPSRQRVEAHESTKSSHPQCCFGIYCPDLPEEERVNKTIREKAPFTSRRWLGLYWADGNAVASLALLGSVTNGGQCTAKSVQGDVRISVGDVLCIETRPERDPELPNSILFYVNNKEVARVSVPLYMPVSSHMESCYFGVMLSAGASVAVLQCSA